LGQPREGYRAPKGATAITADKRDLLTNSLSRASRLAESTETLPKVRKSLALGLTLPLLRSYKNPLRGLVGFVPGANVPGFVLTPAFAGWALYYRALRALFLILPDVT
jgi:hypothetical protein